MLKQRILTALVLLPLMIGMLFFAGERLWAAFAGLIALLALWEYARICHMRAWQNALYLVISFCGGLYLYHSGFRFSLWQHAAVLVFWLLLVPLWLKYKWKVKADLWGALLGWVLLLPFWLALISLRPNTAAAGYLLAVMGMVWLADVAAYFVGRAIGKRKLAPTISPNKSCRHQRAGRLARCQRGLGTRPVAPPVCALFFAHPAAQSACRSGAISAI